MRCVIQRAAKAEIQINGLIAAKIDRGIVVLVGFHEADDKKVFDYISDKITNLRIFEDSDGKMNLSVSDISGDILIVPNFTLYGDARKGRRPSYIGGAAPDKASELFNDFSENISSAYSKGNVKFGIFQADMQLSLINDGPVTILVDSDKVF